MTWHFDPTNQTADVYDHTDSVVATDVPVTSWTIDNDGNIQDPPTSVLQVMEDEIVAEFQANGTSNRFLQILRDAVFLNIQEGTP